MSSLFGKTSHKFTVTNQSGEVVVGTVHLGASEANTLFIESLTQNKTDQKSFVMYRVPAMIKNVNDKRLLSVGDSLTNSSPLCFSSQLY